MITSVQDHEGLVLEEVHHVIVVAVSSCQVGVHVSGTSQRAVIHLLQNLLRRYGQRLSLLLRDVTSEFLVLPVESIVVMLLLLQEVWLSRCRLWVYGVDVAEHG